MELTGEEYRTFEGSLLRKYHTLVDEIRSGFNCCPGLILLFLIWNFQIGTSELIPEQQILKYLVNSMRRTLSRVFLWVQTAHVCSLCRNGR